MPKIKVTLSIDEQVWRTFRGRCVSAGVSASKIAQAWMALANSAKSVGYVEMDEKTGEVSEITIVQKDGFQ